MKPPSIWSPIDSSCKYCIYHNKNEIHRARYSGCSNTISITGTPLLCVITIKHLHVSRSRISLRTFIWIAKMCAARKCNNVDESKALWCYKAQRLRGRDRSNYSDWRLRRGTWNSNLESEEPQDKEQPDRVSAVRARVTPQTQHVCPLQLRAHVPPQATSCARHLYY